MLHKFENWDAFCKVSFVIPIIDDNLQNGIPSFLDHLSFSGPPLNCLAYFYYFSRRIAELQKDGFFLYDFNFPT